jgi:DNA recombination-mediator protein A
MARLVGVVGSRSLPASFAPLVSSLVSLLVDQDFGVASGGASGADAFALSALLGQGAASRSVLFSAWPSVSGFPLAVRPQVASFLSAGGQVVWGSVVPGSSRHAVVSGLFARSRQLVSASCCLVAFLHGPSRGTLFTVRHALSCGIPVIVFLCGGGAALPADLVSRCIVFDKGGE